MKKIIGAVVAFSALLVLSGCYNQSATPSATKAMPTAQNQPTTVDTASTNVVNIQNFAFSPETLIVKKGTTVAWTNNDSTLHTIKSTTFNSGDLAKGATFKFTFDTAGTFSYSCGIHPSMQGKIVVE